MHHQGAIIISVLLPLGTHIEKQLLTAYDLLQALFREAEVAAWVPNEAGSTAHQDHEVKVAAAQR